MNTKSENAVTQDSIESLLEKAEPRPTPPPQMEQDVRAAVQAEWQTVTGQRRRRRTGRNVAIAATVLIAVVAAFTSLQQTTEPAVEVAVLDQSTGTIRLHGEEPGAADDTSTLFAGQTLQTGSDSAAGLTWGSGGSVRVDEQTRVEFVSDNEIFLHKGRVYFDSLNANGEFAIRTEHGVVTHVGTQYMAAATDTSLVVSVREGEVLVEGNVYDQTINHGQRAELSGSNRPVITNTSGVGDDWAWAETVSPRISVDGMTAFDFLQWVGRETGHSIHFASESVDQTARTTELKGTVNADPRTELRLRMLTMDLDARFEAERKVITVTDQQ